MWHTTHPVSRSLHFEAGVHRCRRASNLVLVYDISAAPSTTANLSPNRQPPDASCHVKYSSLTIVPFSLAMNPIGMFMFSDDTEEEKSSGKYRWGAGRGVESALIYSVLILSLWDRIGRGLPVPTPLS